MALSLYHNFPQLARDAGFSLCESENENEIDWRFIASIDNNRIIRESLYEKLDECIPSLIKSSVGNLLNVRILDPAIAKFYVSCQLGLQYLVFCTKFLDQTVLSLRETIFDAQKKTLKLEEVLENREEEILLLQKKLQKQEILHRKVYPCSRCTKNFISSELLSVHVTRKHKPNEESKSIVDKDSNLINTIKLELEIKQLKERLNTSEKELMDNKKMECKKCLENSLKQYYNVGIQSNFEVKEKDEREKDYIEKRDLQEILSSQLKQFEEWKITEEQKYSSEILDLRTKLDKTIELLKHKEDNVMPMNIAEKCVGTNRQILIEKMTQVAKEPEPETHWKLRYQELEENQRKISSSVFNIEKMYSAQIRKIEDSVQHLKDVKVSSPEIVPTPSIRQHVESRIIPELKTTLYKNVQTSSSSESSEEDEVIKQLPEVIQKQKEDSPPLSTIQSFSAQKFFIRQKSAKSRKSASVEIQSSKEKALDLFQQRLNKMGISDKNRLNKSEYEKLSVEMVQSRESAKKVNKSFFITRKRINKLLMSKFDGATAEIMKKQPEKSGKIILSKEQQLTSSKKSNLQVVADVNDIPSKIPVPLKRKEEPNVEPLKLEEIIEPTKETNLQDKLEKVQDNLFLDVDSEILSKTKKKVSFQNNEIDLIQKLREESDWNISSFEDD
ncbi:unnamed protein product [Diamesa serratosioi]